MGGSIVPDDDPRGAIRGMICRDFVEWTVDELGPEEVARALSRADPGDLEDLDLARPGLGILPSVWYPASRMHRLLDVLFAAVEPSQRLRLAASAGEHVFEAQMSGLQRAIFRLMLTPDRYVKHAHRAWRHNFTNGELAYERMERAHRCTYTGWRAHHPLICRMMMAGKLTVYRAMGLPDPRVEVVRCARGEGCESIVRW